MKMIRFRNRPRVHRVVNMPAEVGGGFGVAVRQSPNRFWPQGRFRVVPVPDVESVWIQGKQPVGRLVGQLPPLRLCSYMGVGLVATPQFAGAGSVFGVPTPGWTVEAENVSGGPQMAAIVRRVDVGGVEFWPEKDRRKQRYGWWVAGDLSTMRMLLPAGSQSCLVRPATPTVWWAIRPSPGLRRLTLYRCQAAGADKAAEFDMPPRHRVVDFDVTADGRRVLAAVRQEREYDWCEAMDHEYEVAADGFSLWEFAVGCKKANRAFDLPARRLAIAPDGATVAFHWVRKQTRHSPYQSSRWLTAGLGVLDLE